MPEIALIVALSASMILLLVCIPTSMLLIIRYYQTRVAQIFPILGMTIACIALALNDSVAFVSSKEQIENLHGPITITLWAICFVLFAFFLAGLTRNSIFCRETAIALLLAGIVGGLVWKEGMIQAFHENGISYFRSDFAIWFFLSPLMLFIGLWGFKVLNKTREFAVNEKQEKQQRIFSYGLITAFFGTIVVGTISGLMRGRNTELRDVGLLISVVNPNLLIGLGLACVGIVYGHHKEVIFLQPQQLYSLMVVESTGLPLYSFQFKRKESSEADVDPGLTAAALTAITSFLREAVGSTEEFREIVTADKIVLAKAGRGFFSVLVGERSSSFVHLALAQFTTSFTKDYGDRVEKFTGNLADFKDVERVVTSAFGME